MESKVVVIISREGKIPVHYLNLIDQKVKVVLEAKPFLDLARNFALYHVKDYDRILMIDDDVIPKLPVSQIFNNELIEKYDVVCGIYWLKSHMATSVAVPSIFGERTWLPQPPSMPVEVNACGTGFLLINGRFVRETFAKAKEVGGWFDVKIEDWEEEKYEGEDVYFFDTFKPRAVADPRLVAWHKAYGEYYFNEYGVIEAIGGVKTD